MVWQRAVTPSDSGPSRFDSYHLHQVVGIMAIILSSKLSDPGSIPGRPAKTVSR